MKDLRETKGLRDLFNDLRVVRDILRKSERESSEWLMLEARVFIIHNRCSVIYFTDWKRRARWVSLGVLVGGLVAALAMTLFMRGCR